MIDLQSERRFTALIEKTADAILLINNSTDIAYANPAAGTMLGYNLKTMTAMSIYDLIHPLEQVYIEKQLKQASGPGSDQHELRLKCRDGSWLWVEGTFTNLLHDPQVNGIFLNFRDISDRKEAQYNLQSQKDLMQNLVVIARATSEAAELGDMLQNLLRIGKWLTLANNGSIFLFDDIGALAFTQSYYGRLDPERVQNLMEEGLTGWVIKNDQPALISDTQTDERWLELASDGYIPRSAIAIPIYSGQVLLAILVLTHSTPDHFNSSHLKTLQAASGQMAMAINNARLYNEARSNLADLNALIESSQDGIVLVSIDGYLRVINAAALNMVQLMNEPADLIGCSVVELYRLARRNAPKLIKILIAQSRRVMAGENTTEEGECRTSLHQIHWLHTPITTNFQTIGWLVVLRDITERRKLEQQREELTDMIVHDLRNPASAVSGIVAMLKSLKHLDEVPDDYNQMVQLAERNVNKILELVQEILDVSQLESGQLPVEKTPVNLDQLIDETLQLQRPIIAMKEMNLEKRIQPDLPQAWADERLIRRVLQNLVDNASKFSRRNTSIIITAKISAVNPEMIQISVQDFGIGIPLELQGRVFEKFVTDRTAQRGSGIGLTFCRLAVLAHDGKIWAESEENHGSTFFFTLPISSDLDHPA
jgi:PAS domain S-box-containing protein